MMKLKTILLTLLVLCTTVMYGYTQVGKGLYMGAYRSSITTLNDFPPMFSSSEFQFGLQFEKNTGSVSVFGVYQLFGNKKIEGFEAYTFASQLLGLGFEYRSNNEKIISIISGISLATEIYSNYRNGYMNGVELAFPNLVKYPYDYYASTFEKSYTYYSNAHYQSTPLSASIWFGVNAKLFKNISVNLSLVNDIRLVSQKYLKWDMTDKEEEQENLIGKDINELIEDQPTTRSIIDRFGLRFGLSYTLPLSKTK